MQTTWRQYWHWPGCYQLACQNITFKRTIGNGEVPLDLRSVQDYTFKINMHYWCWHSSNSLPLFSLHKISSTSVEKQFTERGFSCDHVPQPSLCPNRILHQKFWVWNPVKLHGWNVHSRASKSLQWKGNIVHDCTYMRCLCQNSTIESDSATHEGISILSFPFVGSLLITLPRTVILSVWLELFISSFLPSLQLFSFPFLFYFPMGIFCFPSSPASSLNSSSILKHTFLSHYEKKFNRNFTMQMSAQRSKNKWCC